MEQVPIITESVQYGVIGICIMLIVANVFIVKVFIGAVMKLYDKIDELNGAISTLSMKVELLTFAGGRSDGGRSEESRIRN